MKKRQQRKSPVNCWGYEFEWTEQHRAPEQLHSMLYAYDHLADECLQLLTAESRGKLSKEKDLYCLLRDSSDRDPKLSQLWSNVNAVPEWVDWEQIGRGQEVFYRYGLPILSAVSSLALCCTCGNMLNQI